jgi:hypothetical protein
MISVIDFEGFSLFGGDNRFSRALGQSSEMSALYYPQVHCCTTKSDHASP